jgi:hypothetical protein
MHRRRVLRNSPLFRGGPAKDPESSGHESPMQKFRTVSAAQLAFAVVLAALAACTATT